MEGFSEGISNAGAAVSGAGFEKEALEAGRITAELLSGVAEEGGGVPFAPTELLLYIVSSVFSVLKENSGLILSFAAICLLSLFLSGLAKDNGLLNKSAGTDRKSVV